MKLLLEHNLEDGPVAQVIMRSQVRFQAGSGSVTFTAGAIQRCLRDMSTRASNKATYLA